MRLEDDPQHLPKPLLQLLSQLPPHDLLQGADGRLEEGGDEEEVVYLQNIREKSFNEKRENKEGGKFGDDSRTGGPISSAPVAEKVRKSKNKGTLKLFLKITHSAMEYIFYK